MGTYRPPPTVSSAGNVHGVARGERSHYINIKITSDYVIRG